MNPASVSIRRSHEAKLMVIDERGEITHVRRSEFPGLVRSGDVVVANDAATLPASLTGVHVPTGAEIELRLAGRTSLLPECVNRFVAVVFGAGDFRTPTERRPFPPTLTAGDELWLGPLRAQVVNVLGHPRLVDVRFQNSVEEIWEGLARHGRPIQYAYVSDALAIWDTWTAIAALPAAFEPPSAGFVFDWATIGALRQRGTSFATVTHAAGISSTGDPDLDRRLPLDEPYFVPSRTAAAIAAARRCGGRVVAIGTTVVRALEHAGRADGTVEPGRGIATRVIDGSTSLRVVDVVLSGTHEPGTSHYELLRAFQSDETLRRVADEEEAHGYTTHEFGDSIFASRGLKQRSLA